jgi:hypothetical protein
MKASRWLWLPLFAAACAGGPSQPPTPSAPASATASPMPGGATASPQPSGQTATELLDCRGGPSEVGGSGKGMAFEGGGATPDDALSQFLANTAFVIPRAGYEPLGQSGERFAFGFRADGDVKVVVVISSRFAEVIGESFAAEELRTCPSAEFGSEAVFNDGRRTWTNLETGAVLTDIVGPGHCAMQSARLLHLEHPDGSFDRQYVRDPEGVLADHPGLLEAYAEDVDLPADAIDSGYRSPEGYELWFTDADTAAYVVTPDGVEQWPRADPPIGCA